MQFVDSLKNKIDSFCLKFKSLFTDEITISGQIDYVVKKNGQIISEGSHNMITNVAKDVLARLLGGDVTGKSITKLAVNADSAAAQPTDSAMADAFVKAVDGHDYPETGQVRFAWSIGINEANGIDIWRFGLMTNDETLFAVKVRPNHPIYKDEEISVEGTWKIIL